MRGPAFDPFAGWRSAWAFWSMMAEAQTVVALRLMGMAGALPSSPRERHIMVAEKGPAFARAAMAAGAAAVAGKLPDQIAQAAIRPIARRTGANVRRLTKPKRRT